MLLPEYNEAEAMELFKEEGREEGIEREIVAGIRWAMEKQKLTLNGAMEYMDIPRDQRHKYALHFCASKETAKYQAKET